MISAAELQNIARESQKAFIEQSLDWARETLPKLEEKFINAAKKGDYECCIEDFNTVSANTDDIAYKANALFQLLGPDFKVRLFGYGGIRISWVEKSF